MATVYPRERELVHGEHQLFPQPAGSAPAPAVRAVPKHAVTSWWVRHGEMVCAIISGLLLLAAAILSWTVPGGAESITYHLMVYIAFTLGFIFGSLEAWGALRHGKLDIHFLMVLGAVLALIMNKEMEGAILLFLFTLSGALEEYAMQRTHAALESLMKLFPKEAVVLGDDGAPRLVKLDALEVGDRVLVKPGENVAADGKVIEGASAIDESAITGEYLPREKSVGSTVYAGTLNTSGRLVIRVEKPSHDTTLAKIIHLVSEAREEKAPVEQLFEKIGTAYTIGVLAMSVGAALVLHYAMGLPWVADKASSGEAGAIYRAITLLIVASPCALIISTPVVLLSAIATCARKGVVLKGGRHLESLAALKALVFDKTGTLTTGRVQLVAIEFVDTRHAPLHCDWPNDGGGDAPEDEKPGTAVAMSSSLRKELADSVAVQEAQICAGREVRIGCTILRHGEADAERLLLKVAAVLEANSTHPLASAVLQAAKAGGIGVPAVDQFVQEPGVGLRGVVEGEPAILGSPNLLSGLCHTLSVNRLCERVSQVEGEGETAVVIYYGGLAGILRFQDTVRADARATVDRLHALNVRPLVMLTGDNRQTAEGVAKSLGLDEVRAELLPQDKLKEVEKLVAAHEVVGMVGDGINDAPALARATVGIAMGSIGSDAALEAADVVLLSDRIDRLPWLVETARRARVVMIQNLVFAISVIAVLVVCSFIGKVGLPLGVVGHEGSTVLVVFNGLRLLWAKEPAGG